MKKPHTYYVYIITNYNKTVLYTGMTNNLARRLVEHFALRGTNYSFAGKYYTYNLLYYETYPTRHQAFTRERELKTWIRQRKDDLIATQNPKWLFRNKEICKEWQPRKIWGEHAKKHLAKKQKEFANKSPNMKPPLNNIVLYEETE